jgi:AraC family transcriptional regulator, regulatory protein of adaptative response / methylated-DNA-[protein]-cysteine methyltransferase
MLNENTLWRAVVDRDPHWDGVFVYGVRSTGIYCRSTCPSRRPRRDRVRFFPRTADAQAAGFRACRRCKPDADAAGGAIGYVRRACEVISRRQGAGVPLAALARTAGVGAHQLLRAFKQALGVTPREYADAVRAGCLKTELRAGGGVASAGYAAGYGSGSRVYERAGALLGMTPARYAAGAKGETVTYAITECSLGHLLVASTPRGICSVRMGSSRTQLEHELREEFAAAALERSDPSLARTVKTIVGAIERNGPDPRLPLDVRATAFQRRVWQELQRIPRGETRTYREIARRIGRPTATRAVARACATNPVALLIPCHRVIRTDGTEGGYRWGLERKQELLDREKNGHNA